MKSIVFWLAIFLSINTYSQSNDQIASELCNCFNVDSLVTKEAVTNCIYQTVEKYQMKLVGHTNELKNEEIGQVITNMTPQLFDCKHFMELANNANKVQDKSAGLSANNFSCNKKDIGEFWSADSTTVVILENIEIMYAKTAEFTRVGIIEWIDSCSYVVTLLTDGGDGVLKKGDEYTSRVVGIKSDSSIWETNFKGFKFKYFLIRK